MLELNAAADSKRMADLNVSIYEQLKISTFYMIVVPYRSMISESYISCVSLVTI